MGGNKREEVKLETVFKNRHYQSNKKNKIKTPQFQFFLSAVSLFILVLSWQGPQKRFEQDNEVNCIFNNQKLRKHPWIAFGMSFSILPWFPSGLLLRQGCVHRCLKPFLVPKNSPRFFLNSCKQVVISATRNRWLKNPSVYAISSLKQVIACFFKSLLGNSI